jgi:hypothetical protein
VSPAQTQGQTQFRGKQKVIGSTKSMSHYDECRANHFLFIFVVRTHGYFLQNGAARENKYHAGVFFNLLLALVFGDVLKAFTFRCYTSPKQKLDIHQPNLQQT